MGRHAKTKRVIATAIADLKEHAAVLSARSGQVLENTRWAYWLDDSAPTAPRSHVGPLLVELA